MASTPTGEAIFRQAQLSADADDPELMNASILFRLAVCGKHFRLSRGQGDREPHRAINLTDLLTMAVKARPTGEITLIAHSMGGWLTIEALRQLKPPASRPFSTGSSWFSPHPISMASFSLAQMQKIGR